MNLTVKTTGLKEISARINAEVKRMHRVTMDGLLAGGLQVQRTAQGRTPVDVGNLKASAYTRKAQSGGMAVEVGYTSDYAIYVHEDLQARHEVGQAKFLTSALRDEERHVQDIVERYASVSQ